MNRVLILDFGSQYTQLIARRIRELKVYCEIWPCTESFEKITAFAPAAIVLSGGPASVLAKGSPSISPKIYELGVPVLGICYGLQLTTKLLGGKVVRAEAREYGLAEIAVRGSHPLLDGVPANSRVWMSHGDSVKTLAPGFVQLAATEKGVPAVVVHESKNISLLQFHPEVHHTVFGKTILQNFLFRIAKLKPDWSMHDFVEVACRQIRDSVGKDKVILGLSGGVDSSVAAVLIQKAIGKQLTCIFVDNGLLRLNEAKQVRELFKNNFSMSLKTVDAGKAFLKGLKGVSNPEKKRKIIGRIFVEVFQAEAKKIKGAKFLAQGTLYPDVIESVSFKGPSAVIKSHHNVGGLPKRMGLKLLEPLRELFKDEVRELGRELGLPRDVLGRHPFPGPGLAVRILGPITSDGVKLLQKADAIVREEIATAGLHDKIWQAFAVLLPVRSVGVMGDERTYENACAVRAVESVDGMTADWFEFPKGVLAKMSNRIINEVKGINRVVYDISSKPPATIEWE